MVSLFCLCSCAASPFCLMMHCPRWKSIIAAVECYSFLYTPTPVIWDEHRGDRKVLASLWRGEVLIILTSAKLSKVAPSTLIQT